jgi:23S rRNA pseudoU1915 N3-methylase RlmH
LAGLPAQDFNIKWVVLADDRIKVRIPTTVDGNTRLAEYVIALSVMREPVHQDELIQIATKADARKADADKRKADEAKRLTNEKEAAFKWGQSAMLTAMKEISTIQQTAQTLAGMVNRAPGIGL